MSSNNNDKYTLYVSDGKLFGNYIWKMDKWFPGYSWKKYRVIKCLFFLLSKETEFNTIISQCQKLFGAQQIFQKFQNVLVD